MIFSEYYRELLKIRAEVSSEVVIEPSEPSKPSDYGNYILLGAALIIGIIFIKKGGRFL